MSISKIAHLNALEILDTTPLPGGAINEVTLLTCHSGKYVVKTNNAYKFPGMFAAEAKGLQLLEASKSFITPKVLNKGVVDANSYLLLEYLPTGNPSKNFDCDFAQSLTQLHRTTQPAFGLDHSNYIGSLPQYNASATTAASFYIQQRLEPQFKMAFDRGFKFSGVALIFKNMSNEIPEAPPALVHGDLWNGNYLISDKGNPILIDPAVAFAPREMDLAMMQLFGGFSEAIFTRYHELFPLEHGWQKRMDLWQLYYLLVHLNLFGNSYLESIKQILRKYS